MSCAMAGRSSASPSTRPVVMPAEPRCVRVSSLAYWAPTRAPCSINRRSNFDPGKILAVMMQREKSGGHSERSIAIGTIEVAVWDAVAKIAGQPLHRMLAERYNDGRTATKVFCYVGGGWYCARPDGEGPARRDAPASRRRLHDGQDESRGSPACRGPAPGRGRQGDAARQCPACGRCQLQVRPRPGPRLCRGAGAVPPALVRGALRSARLRPARRDRAPL